MEQFVEALQGSEGGEAAEFLTVMMALGSATLRVC